MQVNLLASETRLADSAFSDSPASVSHENTVQCGADFSISISPNSASWLSFCPLTMQPQTGPKQQIVTFLPTSPARGHTFIFRRRQKREVMENIQLKRNRIESQRLTVLLRVLDAIIINNTSCLLERSERSCSYDSRIWCHTFGEAPQAKGLRGCRPGGAALGPSAGKLPPGRSPSPGPHLSVPFLPFPASESSFL